MDRSDHTRMEYPKVTDKELETLAEKFGFRAFDPEHMREGLDKLIKMIVDSGLKIGLNDRWYRYYATDNTLTHWVANDGAVIDASLADMIADHYEDDDFMRALTEFEDFCYGDLEYFLAKKR